MPEINKNDLFSDDALNAPKELAKNLGAVADSIDKITAASQKSEEVLKKSTSPGKILKETEQLTLQEKELMKVQNQISVALAKNNDEYIEHKRGLDAINKAVKEKIMKGREDQTLTGQLTKGIKELKAELKQAQSAMIAAGQAGGKMSKEYQEAAKQAGNITDQINDAKDEAKAFAGGNDFENIGTRVGLLANEVKNLNFAGVGEQLKGLGRIILANPLLLLAGIVIGVVAALIRFRDSIPFVATVFEKLGNGVDYVVQKLKDFTDWMGISEFAATDKAKAVIEGAKSETEAIAKYYDQQIAIAAAAGKDTVELEKKKWEEIKAVAEAGMKSAFDPTKALKDQSDDYKSFVETVADANTQIQILNNKAIQEDLKERKKANEERIKMEKETAEYIKKVIANLPSEKAKQHQAELDLKKQFVDKFKELGADEVDISAKVDAAILKGKQSINKGIIDSGAGATKEYLRQQQEQRDGLISTLEETQAIYQAFSESIGELFASINANRLMELEQQKRANKDKLDRDLEAAGNNEAAKEQIKIRAAKVDEQIAAEQLKIKQRQARYDKATALFNAGLNVAIAITKAIPNPVLIALTSALGAIQIAAIAAKPIPKFAKGVKNFTGGPAIVGERGRELIRMGNDTMLTPDKATLVNLPKGADVIPNQETMRMMADVGTSTKGGDWKLYSKVDDLEKAIRQTSKGVERAIASSNGDLVKQGSLIYKVKETLEGNKKLIRKKLF